MVEEHQQAGLTVKKDDDFSEWYTQVVQKAELADYSSVKGCMIIRPHAYSIWESIQDHFNQRLKALKVQNAYFPLFIPESFFKKEMEHAKGFKPEVAWIANKDEGERLAIRPTSETIIYDSYSRWIRSHRDLPLRINQWGNVVRWETKATRLFLRTREFLWQEGHCIYASDKECLDETLIYLQEYKKLCEELLAIPVLAGKKSDNEKFAGAVSTFSIDTLMPDGRALQMGTSHFLGQSFAKAFNIHFKGKDEKDHTPWQNSWGISTRLIGALVMVHGDDKGLVLPPRAVRHKIVIIPITYGKEREKVEKKAQDLAKQLSAFDPILDDREGYSPGWKFNEWELKGIPLRIEIGPKDIEKDQVVVVRRDQGKKLVLPFKKITSAVPELLEEMQKDLFIKAHKFLSEHIFEATTWKDFEKGISEKKMIKASWCQKASCEEAIKQKTGGVKTINMPFDQPKTFKSCVHCKEPGTCVVYFAKSY